MNKVLFQIDVWSGSFGILTGIRRNIKPQIRTESLPTPGFATSKAQTRCWSLRRKLRVYARKQIGCCEAESCAVVEVDVTLLLCRIERDVKRFVDLAALDSALYIFFSSSSSSARSWCLYSRTVFHPYCDLSASRINFWRSWSRSIPLSKVCLVFSTSFLSRAIWASSTASLIALFALYCSSLLFLLKWGTESRFSLFSNLWHLLGSDGLVRPFEVRNRSIYEIFDLNDKIFVPFSDDFPDACFIHN